MKDWGPLGMILTLVCGVCIGGVVLWLVGVLWQIGLVLGTLGWPLVLVVLLLGLACGYLVRVHRPVTLARLPQAQLPVEMFCDQCGSQLVSGFCPFCEG